MGGASARSRDGLLRDRLGLGRVLFEVLRERLVGGAVNNAADMRVAELGLRLAFELRLGQAHGDDAGQTLGDVFARQVLVLLLEQVVGPRIGVDDARDGGAEANHVAATLVRIDRVGEGEDRRLVRHVPLQRNVDLDAVLLVAGADDHDTGMDDFLAVVHERDVLGNAAFVLPRLVRAVAALVDEAQRKHRREERHLAHAARERVAVVANVLEDLAVGQERDRGAARAVPRLALRERVLGIALGVVLAEDEAVAADFDVQLLGERVDDGHTDAMETTGDLVAAAAELAAGVQLGEHDLDSGHALVGHHRDGDAAAVVGAGHRPVGMERDRDLGAEPGERLVDGVIEHLPDEVVQTTRARRADIHAWTPSNRFETLENGDVVGAVGVAQRALSIGVTGW